jgi:hypothetical protein
MKSIFYCLLILCSLGKLPAHAQATLPSPAADTVGHRASGLPLRYYMGTVTKTDGTDFKAYLPATRAGYSGGNLIYFLPSPTGDRLGPRKTIDIDVIKTMLVHGRVYETIQHKGKSTGVLALQLLSGPVSLLTYADPRSLPLPLPLAGIGSGVPMLSIPLADKNRWYVQRNGDYLELRRAKFADELSTYLADNPDLAGKIARGESNYLYANVPAIIAEYNAGKTGK